MVQVIPVKLTFHTHGIGISAGIISALYRDYICSVVLTGTLHCCGNPTGSLVLTGTQNRYGNPTGNLALTGIQIRCGNTSGSLREA